MKTLFFILAGFCVSQFAYAKLSKKELNNAKKILEKAEKIRAPDEGKSYVTLTSKNPKKTIDYQLEVLIGDRRTALVEFMEPAIEKGRRLLMKEGQYFAKFRYSKSAVPISRREALGNSTFALADIFRLELTDYNIVAMKKNVKEDDKNLIELHLKAKHKNVPYDRVLYYVGSKEKFPVKAKFFGVSGKHLKSLYVEGRKKYNGVERASVVRMDDAVLTGRKSWWKTKKIKEIKIPKKVFTKDYLVRD